VAVVPEKQVLIIRDNVIVVHFDLLLNDFLSVVVPSVVRVCVFGNSRTIDKWLRKIFLALAVLPARAQRVARPMEHAISDN
jgi:hypothetical protein